MTKHMDFAVDELTDELLWAVQDTVGNTGLRQIMNQEHVRLTGA